MVQYPDIVKHSGIPNRSSEIAFMFTAKATTQIQSLRISPKMSKIDCQKFLQMRKYLLLMHHHTKLLLMHVNMTINLLLIPVLGKGMTLKEKKEEKIEISLGSIPPGAQMLRPTLELNSFPF